MRTPAQLSECLLVGAAEHKRRAANLRKLAGGLRNQRKGECGLDDKEVAVLAAAIALLETMADHSRKAAAIKDKLTADRQARERQVREAMRPSFGTLTSVADRVAFVAAVQSYALRSIRSTSDLEYQVKDALEGLAYTLSGQTPDKSGAVVVDAAWQKFVAAKADLHRQHAALIVLLGESAAAEHQEHPAAARRGASARPGQPDAD